MKKLCYLLSAFAVCLVSGCGGGSSDSETAGVMSMNDFLYGTKTFYSANDVIQIQFASSGGSYEQGSTYYASNTCYMTIDRSVEGLSAYEMSGTAKYYINSGTVNAEGIPTEATLQIAFDTAPTIYFRTCTNNDVRDFFGLAQHNENLYNCYMSIGSFEISLNYLTNQCIVIDTSNYTASTEDGGSLEDWDPVATPQYVNFRIATKASTPTFD